MLLHDAQTSGGLFMSVNQDTVASFAQELTASDPDLSVSVIGEVLEESPRSLYIE
jgi:hypothetical protein